MVVQQAGYKDWEEQVTQTVEGFNITRSDAQGFVEAHEMALAALWRDTLRPETAAVTVFLQPAKLLASLRTQAASGTFIEADDAAYFGQAYLANMSDKIRLRQLVERTIIRQAVVSILGVQAEGGPAFNISVFDGEDTPVAHSRDTAKIMAAIMSTDEDALIVRRQPVGGSDVGPFFGSISLVYGNDGWDVISDNHLSLEDVLRVTTGLADALGDLLCSPEGAGHE